MFWVILAGAAIGLLFDIYRTLRKWIGLGPVMTFIGDIFFSICALILALYMFWRANSLEFRFYIVWGSLLGLIVYLRFFSRIFIKIFFKILILFEKTVRAIIRSLLIPYKGLVIIMIPPYRILRWFSLLIYRILETLIAEPLNRINKKIKNISQRIDRLIYKLKKVWEKFFPPRTDG